VLISILSFLAFLFRWNIVLVFILAAAAALLLQPKISRAAPVLPPAEVSLPQKKGEDYPFLGVLAILICLIFVVCYLVNVPLFNLSVALSKIGALAFGGGFTIIPMIQYEVVDRFQWISTKEFLDGIAMGQVTPGPIMITATFLGYKLAGFGGALMATIAIFSPAFFIVTLLNPQYDRLKKWASVRTMEQGILASFVGMLGLVLYNFGRAAFVNIPSIIFAAAAFFALLKKIDLLYILLSGGILSILVFGLLK
jgi:chromate transporter